jgi:putative phage-type endonuclease
VISDNSPQNSPEWLIARLGIPTASRFDEIITTAGVASKSAKKYMYSLAVERITRVKEESYQNATMQRGIEMEAEARQAYEIITGSEVKEVGLCYPNEKKLYGASPDGLIGDDGCLEIKSPTSAVHVEYLLGNALPTAYFQQTQGQLLVTGRKWCDFMSYFPGVMPLIIRVTPDKLFQKSLAVELEIFCKGLEQVTEQIRSK